MKGTKSQGEFSGRYSISQQSRLSPCLLYTSTAAILGGADLVRVHDVKEAVQAARMADALCHLSSEG